LHSNYSNTPCPQLPNFRMLVGPLMMS
jgi:hypothetical protein